MARGLHLRGDTRWSTCIGVLIPSQSDQLLMAAPTPNFFPEAYSTIRFSGLMLLPTENKPRQVRIELAQGPGPSR